MSVKPLDGLVVVDLGVGMAAALVAKYLAEAGARIIRAEPPEGDPFQGFYPAYDVWRRNLEVDAAAQQTPERLFEVLADADVCILGGEDYPALQRRDADLIATQHPRLVVLDIAAYPSGTMHAGRPGADVLVQARAGLVWEQGDERPILMGYQPCHYGAALFGIMGVLAALYERESSGRGQIARTSLFEGALSWMGILWSEAERSTPAIEFVIPKGAVPLILKCKDGVLIHIVIGAPGSKYGMYKALEIDDPSVKPNDSSVPDLSGDPTKFFGDYELLAASAAKMTSEKALKAIWAQGLPAEPVLKPGDCWDDPQVKLNGIIVAQPDGTRNVGSPLNMRPTRVGPKRNASGVRPLEGIRVVDFGIYVAGPFASAILADFGADVIKVETPAGDPNRFVFRSHTVANRGKRAVCLDMKSAEGAERGRALCRSADVVMSNFRGGVAARLGIDADSLHAQRPDLIVMNSPAYGSVGPSASKSGFDMVMQAFCGHEIRAGGDGNPPAWNRNNMVDFAAGMIGAMAVLTALVHRARSGEGAALENPLLNAGVYLLSELVQGPNGKFSGAPPLNAARTGFHPSEALYRTVDGWVAICARGEEMSAKLAEMLGLSDLGSCAADWGEREGAAIARAIAARPRGDLLADLAQAGIWAEPCLPHRERDILNDPDLQARGNVRVVRHPHYGRIREFGAFVTFSRSRVGNTRHAPLLGESTDEILAELDSQ